MINHIKHFVILNFIVILLISCHHKHPMLLPLYPEATIVAFGDSLTYGTGATLDTSYPHDLQEITEYQVVNAGVPGEETSESVERISSVLDQYQPQLVIVCLGGNDFLRKRPHQAVKDNLRKIILAIQKSGAQVVLIAVPEISLSLSVPTLYQELGNEMNVPVEDKSIAKLLKTPEYKSDYIHFNREGYRIFANDIANFLEDQGAISHHN